jgi:hypothetical protein
MEKKEVTITPPKFETVKITIVGEDSYLIETKYSTYRLTIDLESLNN